MNGKATKAEPFVDHPEFNLWSFNVLSKSALVKLPPTEDGKEHSAYPMQLNPDIYSTLLSIFCDKESTVLHIHANVCMSLVSARELECKILCWEVNAEMSEAGIKHAALYAANKDLAGFEKVSYYLLLLTLEGKRKC